MKNFTIIYKRPERMDQLIRLECTGPVEEFSKKLDVSERTMHNLRSIMENFGKDITFSYTKNSYCYSDNVNRAEVV